MKKLILAIAVLLAATTTTFSQEWKLGGGLTLGTAVGNDMAIGLNARSDYSLNENFSIAPGFTLFFPGSNVSAWQFNGDAHYVFMYEDQFSLYGLGGLNYSHWKWDSKVIGKNTHNEIGINLGAGITFGSMFYGELKYDTAFEQLGISVGVLFSL